ncbi:MAG TPA: molybdenum cofactor biosynthesis protein MoaE [Gemmatimonadaceae bacterium]|nr:molybdenum cofactor biosynthesis protein MoaE [Gemmatimonadaceae bacterium]
MIRAAVVERDIVAEALAKEVAGPGNGAIALFIGTVRSSNEGKPVTGIEYSSYREMAEEEMTTILGEALRSYDFSSAVVEHRVGALEVGEASIGIAVSSPHRRAALDALDYIVEEVKRRAPVWKLELYEDGTREWVGAGAAVAK